MEDNDSTRYEDSFSRLTMALRVIEGMFRSLISTAVAVSSAVLEEAREEGAGAVTGVGATAAVADVSGSAKRRAAAMVDAAAALHSSVFEEYNNVRTLSLVPK